jgi:hypothetical protein
MARYSIFDANETTPQPKLKPHEHQQRQQYRKVTKNTHTKKQAHSMVADDAHLHGKEEQ